MKFQDRDLTDMARFSPPYTAAIAVNVSGGNVSQSFAGYKIVALQSTTAGAIKIDTEDTSGVTIYLPAGYEMRIRVLEIYQTGTAAGLLSGAVTALGFLA
jgi:hypothetical protein